MQASLLDRCYENDVIYKFTPNSHGSTTSFGKVQLHEGSAHVNWYHQQNQLEPLDAVMKKTKTFVFNRQAFLGSVAIFRNFHMGGQVTATSHNVFALIEKTLKTGKKEHFILPKVPINRLKKIIPFAIGDDILSQGWIGTVTDVHVQIVWTFDPPLKTATVTLPVEVVRKLQLKLGQKVETLPQEVFKHPSIKFKSNSWLSALKKVHKKPATLTEMAPASVHVLWLQSTDTNAFPKEPSPVIKSEDDAFKFLKRFHHVRDDLEYFGKEESFQITWTREDQDNVVSYDYWQSHMLLECTGLLYGQDPVLMKRIKGVVSQCPNTQDPVCEVDKEITITPIAVQTETTVIVPDKYTIISHKVLAGDIPEFGPEILPRPHFPNPMANIMNMDMVRDKLDYCSKYGLVLDPKSKQGLIHVKWIYDLGGNDCKEKTEYFSKYDMVPHPTQSEFNPKTQGKVLVTRSGKLGTYKGITYPSCKAVVRLAGSFEEEEHWPHELSYLFKTSSFNTEEKKWVVRECGYPHEKPWLHSLFRVSENSVIIAPTTRNRRGKCLLNPWNDEREAIYPHSFLADSKSSGGMSADISDFLTFEVNTLTLDESLSNVVALERFAAQPELLTLYIAAGPKAPLLEGILFVVDIAFPRSLDGGRTRKIPVRICFRSVGDFKPDWPTSQLDEDGCAVIHIYQQTTNGKTPLYSLINTINAIIMDMDPLCHESEKHKRRTDPNQASIQPAPTPNKNWEYGLLTLLEYKLATLYSFPSLSMKPEVGSHYYHEVLSIWRRLFRLFMNRGETKVDDYNIIESSIERFLGVPSEAFQRSLRRRFELLIELLKASDQHLIVAEYDKNGTELVLRKAGCAVADINGNYDYELREVRFGLQTSTA